MTSQHGSIVYRYMRQPVYIIVDNIQLIKKTCKQYLYIFLIRIKKNRVIDEKLQQNVTQDCVTRLLWLLLTNNFTDKTSQIEGCVNVCDACRWVRLWVTVQWICHLSFSSCRTVRIFCSQPSAPSFDYSLPSAQVQNTAMLLLLQFSTDSVAWL